MSLFKTANNWINHKIVYPYLARIYWNFGIVDKYKSDMQLSYPYKDGSKVKKVLVKKGMPKLMRCRLPNGEFIKFLAEKYKLRTILSLEDDYDKDMDVWCKKYGIIHDTSLDHVSAKTIFQDTKDLKSYLKIMNTENIYPMLIRCRAGADRTGTACAIYRIEKQGWSNLGAWLEMLTFIHFPPKFPWITKFIFNYKKG